MRIDGFSTQNMNTVSGSVPATITSNQPGEVRTVEQVPESVREEPSKPENANIDEEQVIKAIESANKDLVLHNTQLEFSIHEKTKQIMVKVLNTETKEVIREIPPEKILDMVAKLWEMAGILVDERR